MVTDASAGVKNFNLEVEYGPFLDAFVAYVDEYDALESLQHFGVKGMRWGVRREASRARADSLKGLGPDRIERTTKYGEKITLQKAPPNKLNRGLARISKNYVKSYNEGAWLNITDKDGKRVGDANVWKKSDDELYLNWIGIKNDSRGKGYASATLKAAEDFGGQAGFKKMTLEVPGNAPDARHIYQNLGFKVTKEATAEEAAADPVWGGLTEMEYTFGARHDDLVADEIVNRAINTELQHHGVKGMKWGVRNDRGHEGQRAKTKVIEKADKRFEANVSRANQGRWTPELHNSFVSRLNSRSRDLNDSPKYRGKDLTGKLLDQYNKDSVDLVHRAMQDAVSEVYGSNASGTKRGYYNPKTDQIELRDKNLQHAEKADIPDVDVQLTRNKKGFITGFKIVPVKADAELKHYGVPGMKWGVRRDGKTSVAPSSDAAAAKAIRSTIKTSRSTDPISNADLQKLVTRMNLEQQYSRLSSQGATKSRGRKIIEALVKSPEARKAADQLLRDVIDADLRTGTPASYNTTASQIGNELERRRN